MRLQVERWNGSWNQMAMKWRFYCGQSEPLTTTSTLVKPRSARISTVAMAAINATIFNNVKCFSFFHH